MSQWGISEAQKIAVEVLENARAQRKLLEATDGGGPSDDWATLMAMELVALTFAMKPAYQVAGNKFAQEFCESTGINFYTMEAFVSRKGANR